MDHFSIADLNTMNLASRNYDVFLKKGDFNGASRCELTIKKLDEKKRRFGVSKELQRIIDLRFDISEKEKELKQAENTYKNKFY